MTVQQLITLLQRFPGELSVLSLNPDRVSYSPASPPDEVTALLDGDGDWTRDLGEGQTPAADGVRCKVVVLV